MHEAPTAVLIDRIVAKLSGIRRAGGFFTDAGAHIDVDYQDYLAGDWVFPRLFVAEDAQEVTAQNGSALAHRLVVFVEGWVMQTQDVGASRMAHRLKHDIARGLADLRAADLQDIDGAVVTKVEVVGDFSNDRPQDDSRFVVVTTHVNVLFNTYPQPR